MSKQKQAEQKRVQTSTNQKNLFQFWWSVEVHQLNFSNISLQKKKSFKCIYLHHILHSS